MLFSGVVSNAASSRINPPRAEPPEAGPKRYLDPHTLAGVDLSRPAQVGATSFIVHETGYLARCDRWHHRQVQSPFWRLIYNFSPGNHLITAGRRIPLTPAAIIVLPEQTKFDGHGPAAPPHLWLHFSLTREFVIEHRGPITMKPDAILRGLLAQLQSAHVAPHGPLRIKRLNHLSYALLHAIFAQFDAAQYQTWPERLYEILSHIRNHPADGLGNPVLARRAGMSTEAFIRWFKGHVGATPADYVVRTRIRLACQHLILTTATIEQIAEDFGFPNRAYFTRVFSRQMGCGPATFRRRRPAV